MTSGLSSPEMPGVTRFSTLYGDRPPEAYWWFLLNSSNAAAYAIGFRSAWSQVWLIQAKVGPSSRALSVRAS